MKIKMMVLAVTGILSVAATAQEKSIDSKITDVTVFLSRAQVTRVAKTRIDAGKSQLVLRGLSAQLDPTSIQVDGKGKFLLLGISHRQNFLSELTTPRELRILKDSITIYQRQIEWQQSQKELLTKEEQMIIANQQIGGKNQNLTVAELKGMADFFRSRLAEVAANRVKSDDLIRKNTNRITVLQQQLQSQNELFSRNSSEVVISLSAEAPTQVELEVRYMVQQAGWYPVYELRATNTTSPITLNYKANVFQGTGEEWKDVMLKLSTGNPTQSGLKPELYPWYLNFYEPMVLRERVGAGSAKKASYQVQTADLAPAESLAPAAGLADFVETIQTTLNTTFEISLPYTVASSNQPALVDIRQHSVKASYAYAVVPKLETAAFLMARATGWEDFSLLPGEASIFFEGSFVGKSYIDPNNTGDTLAISLGRDPRIVVKRERLKDFDSRGFAGTSKKESHAWEISVRNTKSEPITISIEDQLPVSQNAQIEVSNVVANEARRNDATGKLVWDITLQPNETRKVDFRYELKYPRNRRLNQ